MSSRPSKSPAHAPATVTLADVARSAGVDSSTASRVLNGREHRVAPTTRDRVLDAARALGYEPNAFARGLRTARSYTLGIAVPQLDNPVFAQIIEGAEAAARERGYFLVISHSEDLDSPQTSLERLARVSRVDGILAATLEPEASLARSLERMGLPFVVLNRRLRAIPNYVVFDSFAAARIATDHLISLGHRRIAHLTGRATGYNGVRRLAGYRAALEAAGIEPRTNMIVVAGYSFEGGEAAMRELLRSRERPTGVVVATMLSAAGAMKVLHAHGIAIPGEVSIVAIHDTAIAGLLHPPLTTVRLPTREMGAIATRGLIDLIEGKTSRITAKLAPEQLVIRASTAAPPRRPPADRVRFPRPRP